jgi:serine/threonine protein kinase
MDDFTASLSDGSPSETFEVRPPSPAGFELLQEIGRGAMGVVYRATDLGLGREVAVKVLQGRYPTNSPTARRFLEEARITAQLQHPGVPAVYQVGRLPDDRPYLAMKLIEGETLETLLKSNAPVDPLAVFEAVSQAVGFAHAHGVVHRDLKPSNVMVGAFAEVQVMDWGLSKVLSSNRPADSPCSDPEATTAPTEIQSLRETDVGLTQAGSVLGTPAYMAPEQAAGEVARIDARSDVFGLGAILCAMLTGKPPFDGKDSESVRLDAVRGKTQVAFRRLDECGADPDVVELCKSCLAFEPADRPSTADEVAAAVGRLRRAADERAKRAEQERLSAEVRAAEEIKRRRTSLRAVGVVAVAMFFGVVGTTVGLLRANSARHDAEAAERAAEAKRVEAEAARQAEAAQKVLAEANAAEAQATIRFLEQRVFAAARPKGLLGGLGKDVTLRQAIDASLPALSKEFVDQPLVEAELRMTLGRTFRHLGESRLAVEQYERARAIFTEQRGPDHRQTLQSMVSLALNYGDQGRADDALALNEEARSACRRLLGPDHPLTVTCQINLANSYANHGRHAEAMALREDTLAACLRGVGPDHPSTLMTLTNLSVSYIRFGRHLEATTLREETLDRYRRVYSNDHPDALLSMMNLADSYASSERLADAIRLNEEAAAGYTRLYGPDDRITVRCLELLAHRKTKQNEVGDGDKGVPK